MAFNTTRFKNFAKYDLTINKSFYQNLGIAIMALNIVLAVICFLARRVMYDTTVNVEGHTPFDLDFLHYNFMLITSIWMACLFAISMFIFAGCWAHNLRNKQGRITELTLPASTFERFSWHTLLMLAGGFLLCLLSLAVADGVNALLTIITFGTADGVASLTAQTFGLFNISTYQDSLILYHAFPGDMFTKSQFFYGLVFNIFAGTFVTFCVYHFGNSLKYKYNIILTFIVLQIISTVISALVTICGYAIFDTNITQDVMHSVTSAQNAPKYITTYLYTQGGIRILVGAALILWSYNFYKKAQITSSLNK